MRVRTAMQWLRRSRTAGLGASLGVLAALAWTATATAQEGDATFEGTTGVSGATGTTGTTGDAAVGGGVASFGLGDWLGLGLRLGLVVAVIWIAVAGMRWYVRRVHQGGGRGSLGALEVLETHALGPNRTLHLVRLGDRAVLVGATPERITQLLTVDDSDELERLVQPPEVEAPDLAPAGTRAGVASILSSLGAGLVAMNAHRHALHERAHTQRKAERKAKRQAKREAAAVGTPRTRWFAGLRSALQRAGTRPARGRPPAGLAEAETPRPSLFERTLASIEAVQLEGEGDDARSAPTAAGLRARSGYGLALAPSGEPSRGARAGGVAPDVGAGRPRAEQIAELQRAIAAARRNAG